MAATTRFEEDSTACVRGRRRWAFALPGLLLIVGCPVDNRVLVESDGSQLGRGGAGSGRSTGGVPSVRSSGGVAAEGNDPETSGGASSDGTSRGGASRGGASSGGASNEGTSGAASGGRAGAGFGGASAGGTHLGLAGAGGDPMDPGCPDLDRNAVGDCDETLVQNPDFAAGAMGWTPELQVLQSWRRSDALNNEDPGLLSVSNVRVYDLSSSTLGGTQQCLSAVAGRTYVIAAQVFLKKEQGFGSGGVSMWFLDSNDCSGTPTKTVDPIHVSHVEQWLVTEGSGSATANTRSMLIRLVSHKPFRQPSFEVWFDNVLVRLH